MIDYRQLETQILKGIGEDPSIISAGHILVDIHKDGFLGKNKIFLTGHVESETEKEHVEKTIDYYSHHLEIVDELEIVHQ